jgi:AcrR family transcriptional regulator
MPKIVDHAQRREEIALVACQVVADHGFEQTTVARIARAAGYTTGMVAHYYESKQAIILAALRLMLMRIEARLTRERVGDEASLLDVLDGLLGPGIRRQETEEAQRLGASRVYAAVRPLLRRVLGGVAAAAGRYP